MQETERPMIRMKRTAHKNFRIKGLKSIGNKMGKYFVYGLVNFNKYYKLSG